MLNKFVAIAVHSDVYNVHATFSQWLRDESVRKINWFNCSQPSSITLNPNIMSMKTSVTRQYLERRRAVVCGNCFCIQQLVFCCLSALLWSVTSSWTQPDSPVSHHHHHHHAQLSVITTKLCQHKVYVDWTNILKF